MLLFSDEVKMKEKKSLLDELLLLLSLSSVKKKTMTEFTCLTEPLICVFGLSLQDLLQ